MQQTAYARSVYERNIRRKGGGTAIKKKKTVVDLVGDFCRGVVVFFFTQVGVSFILILYNVIGAFSFRALEGIHGDSSVEETAENVQNYTVNFIWNLTLHLNILEEPLWRTKVDKAVLNYQTTLVPLIRRKNYRGVRPIDAWTIPGSLMYCLSIYTTIGYGNLTPRTDAGKIATIFYALLGMPLMLLYMSNVGEVLAKLFKFVYFNLCSCGMDTKRKAEEKNNLLKKESIRSQDRNLTTNNFNETKPEVHFKAKDFREKFVIPEKTIPIFWCLAVISIYVFFGGLLFAHWEGWTVFDGCYFCYISLSTVGFGDQAPGRVLTDDDGDDTDVETIQILATIYLLVGMALVAMCFNVMQEEALENLKAFWRSLGCLRRKEENEPNSNQRRQSLKGNQVKPRLKTVIYDKYYGYYTKAKENAMEMHSFEKLKHFKEKMTTKADKSSKTSEEL